MKICMLGFPIGKVGGIITFINNIVYGFKKLEHEVDFYAITINKKKKPKNNDYGFENVLGFETDEWLEEYKRTVNKYDLIIFIHPCPHLLKSYTKTTWEKCYSLIKNKPILAWVHDHYYNKYYSWFKDIPSKYNVRIVCPYNCMYESIGNLQAMKIIINNPFKIKECGTYEKEKENIVVDHNNWKGVKHKELLVEYAHEVKYKIISYGDESSFDFRRIKKHENFNLIEHKGWAKKKQIYNDLKRAKVFVNLTKRGGLTHSWDYTITEAIAHGCLPVLQMDVDKDHKITYAKIDKKQNIAYIINSVIKNFKKYKKGITDNLKIIEKLEPIKIAKQVLEYAKQPYKITREHNWW